MMKEREDDRAVHILREHNNDADAWAGQRARGEREEWEEDVESVWSGILGWQLQGWLWSWHVGKQFSLVLSGGISSRRNVNLCPLGILWMLKFGEEGSMRIGSMKKWVDTCVSVCAFSFLHGASSEEHSLKLFTKQQKDGHSRVENIVTGLLEKDRKGVVDGLRKFIAVDTHEVVRVGGLRQGINSFKVVEPKFTADFSDAIIREGAGELTLRAEEEGVRRTCIHTTNVEDQRWRP